MVQSGLEKPKSPGFYREGANPHRKQGELNSSRSLWLSYSD